MGMGDDDFDFGSMGAGGDDELEPPNPADDDVPVRVDSHGLPVV